MISLSRAVGCFADILRRQINMDEEDGWYGEVLDERGEMVEVRSQNEMIRLGASQPD